MTTGDFLKPISIVTAETAGINGHKMSLTLTEKSLHRKPRRQAFCYSKKNRQQTLVLLSKRQIKYCLALKVYDSFNLIKINKAC